MQVIERTLKQDLLKTKKSILLLGLRQTGKTTLLKKSIDLGRL